MPIQLISGYQAISIMLIPISIILMVVSIGYLSRFWRNPFIYKPVKNQAYYKHKALLKVVRAF